MSTKTNPVVSALPAGSELPPAEPRVRRVMVPVYLEVPVMSNDAEQAEFLAAETAKGTVIPCRDGTIRVASLIAPVPADDDEEDESE